MKDPFTVLPKFSDFLGFIDLRSGAYIIAALGIVHTIFFGCTFFMALSYQLVTIWILVTLFSGFSCMLLYGVYLKDDFLITLWIWYSLVFVSIMFLMMFLFICVFCARKEYNRIQYVILAILWYILTIYFIFVVNSYRIDKVVPSNGQNDSVNNDIVPKPNENIERSEGGGAKDAGDAGATRSGLTNNLENSDAVGNGPGQYGDVNGSGVIKAPTLTTLGSSPTNTKVCTPNPEVFQLVTAVTVDVDMEIDF